MVKVIISGEEVFNSVNKKMYLVPEIEFVNLDDVDVLLASLTNSGDDDIQWDSMWD